ncbi:hypothetical protein KMW28_21695 [Flammeovirga yaeyamensis]|uniref:Uncharacterized protein n=1 Tax=Flammeovirga yaeyamensis TaxID=367791 RepID=A0AAX1NBU0_9BACT|nr:hypothetical protein [Flammeovirga yaeyamensis]MBB3697031.1 hypothetical protein [Flammeovirga yaeyamensis]NMF33694.1 hypothetical protein [Flammeovirga yaeyamensis]QWG05040.1 hypothetical protein KMW28_21695 [Flammeovirga yaeyamensis]
MPNLDLNILDQQDNGTFSSSYGKNLDKDLFDWIQLCISFGPSELSFTRLNTLAFFIFVELSGRHFGEPKRFEVSTQAKTFQEFMYRFNTFKTMKIPFQEWSQLIPLLFEALEEMLKRKSVNIKSEKSKKAFEKHSSLLKKITSDIKYDDKFTDFLNGAI